MIVDAGPTMALQSLTVSVGQSVPHTGGCEPDVVDCSDVLCPSDRQKAFVLIAGGGMASHWASIWIFEAKADIFSVELTAVEDTTGYRWRRARGKMRHLLSSSATCIGATSNNTQAFFELTATSTSWPFPAGFAKEASANRVQDEDSEHDCFLPCTDSRALLQAQAAAALDYICSRASADSCIAEQRDRVQECIVNFIAQGGESNYIMTGDLVSESRSGVMEVESTTPFQLYHRSQQVSLHGSFYDLLFHNCQLYILQLMHDKYKVEFSQLPRAVGSVVAGPLMLTLEVIFMAVFSGLEQVHASLAVSVGVLWILAEMRATYMYEHSDGFWSGVLATILILIYAMFDEGHHLVVTIPVLSLLWDVCMVKEAMLVNKVYESHWLMLLNAICVLLALGVVCLLQVRRGWPVVDLVISGALPQLVLLARGNRRMLTFIFDEFFHADILLESLIVLFRLKEPAAHELED